MEQRLRRALPFFLTIALPYVGGFDWYAHSGGLCNAYRTSCYESALLKTVGIHLAVLVVAVVVAVVATRRFSEQIELALDYRLGRLLFDPSNRTLAVLVPLVLATLAFARPLFSGQVTSIRSVWLALLFPYYPFITGILPLIYIIQTVEPPFVEGMLLLVGTVLLAGVVEVVWLYLLSASLGRVLGGLWRTVEALGVR